MTIGERLQQAAVALAAAGVADARREARLLLMHATGLDAAALLRDRSLAVDAPGFDALVAARARRVPLAFLVGHQPFWSFDVAVSPDTLVPRADSEALIEAALAAFPERGAVRRVLDLGTGTGCLLLAALTEFPNAWSLGIDLSPSAAALAQANAARLGLTCRAAFACGDWGDAVHGRFDLVVCNPPYVMTDDLAGLMPEVALHEPARALDGGIDGLAAYRRVTQALPALLSQEGRGVLELGVGQLAAVSALAHAAGLAVVGHCDDLAGIARALVLSR